MVEFNPDGSIKLPGNIVKTKEENASKLKNQRCMKVSKEIINSYSPKKCSLKIQLSEFFKDPQFVANLFNQFNEKCSTPVKLSKIDDFNFEVEIGTDFRRCTNCNSLIGKYREFLDGNVIIDKGICTFESRQQNFSYEDYFE